MSTQLQTKSGVLLLLLITFASCQKPTQDLNPVEETAGVSRRSQEANGHLKQTKTFSSEVAIKWMDMQVQQMRNYPANTIGNVAFARQYAYSGITLYEAVVPGMPAYQTLASQLNGLSDLPKTAPGLAYHWAASANAALAYINKKMFPLANTENKAAMDALEASLLTKYSSEADAATIERSVEFGKGVAHKIFAWSETDGYQHLYDPYTPPVDKTGGIYWTPPSPMPVHTVQYFGNIRRLVPGSGEGADPGPPDYAALPAMTADVIASKPAVGTANYSIAFWWRDFPGTSTPGHYVSILRQVLQKGQSGLDKAALAYALGGITVVDIAISTWQAKFKYLLARPFNYDDVMGTPFTALLGAPHPEYPAAHAAVSIANAEAMTHIFGDNYAFTDSTFNGLFIQTAGAPAGTGITLSPRSYNSFLQAGEEAGWSRLYAGIHYRKSIEVGFWQGKKVANTIINKLNFLKE